MLLAILWYLCDLFFDLSYFGVLCFVFYVFILSLCCLYLFSCLYLYCFVLFLFLFVICFVVPL